ncbi:MAG: molybdopterin-dependent oxidoreductase, partial [Acetobacteraceae bacterium]
FPEGIEAAVAAARADAPDIAATAERCGLAARDVAAFFAWVRDTPSTVTLFSQGVNQSTAGTDKVNAIINTHLLTGRIGRPGAGPFSVTGQPNAMGGREVGALANMLAAHLDWERPGDLDRLRRFWDSEAVPARPGLKAVDLFRAIGEGRVKAVWILGTNPAVSLPQSDAVRQALGRCDFVVVSDCAAGTDTGAFAQVRLPALGWGEKDGTVTNSERMISRQRGFLPPPGEARADWWALAQVAARMGHGARFAWRGPADIFREHAALSGFENAGARVFDISALAHLTDDEYDRMRPTRWPCPASRPGRERLLGTADDVARLRMVKVTWRPEPAGDLPFTLLTGRLRDQWHTMTRTGSVPRLMAHSPEPVLAMHPDDTTLPDGALARVRSADGGAVLRLRHDPGLARGMVFAPMHWTAALCPPARINAAVAGPTDPVSGQPALKCTAVAVEPFPARWSGFILARRRLAPDLADWCAVIPEPDGVWRHELAGLDAVTQALSRLSALLDVDARWLRLDDPGRGQHRAVRVRDGVVDACLFLSAGGVLPARGWLVRQFRPGQPPAARMALLIGAPPGGAAAAPLVCVCNGVDAACITAAIRAGADTIEAVGAVTAAGTGCGSCRPEIRALLATPIRIPEPA